MTPHTESQLLEAYAGILADAVNPHSHPSPPRVVIEAYELNRVFGEKLAYLAAMRRGFDLSADGREWSRLRGPATDETVRIFPQDFATQANRARKAIDPLDLLAPFTRGRDA